MYLMLLDLMMSGLEIIQNISLSFHQIDIFK